MSTVLNRSREELTAGEITLSVAVDEYPISNGEGQIRTFSLYMYLLMTHEPIHQALLLDSNLFPTSNGVSVVEKAYIKPKFLKFVQRHGGILGVGCCRI